ncbi:PAS domain-containing sensor histidine kinase [Pedobacter duraquae]|uniref:histidine kinase n=1 Tax=Pedobacter duraquae TaxID=425511 RepID=A0A4R6IG54_9SPHI|nr:ATP-binding protein [Pedobacter duraquae]TDO20796.1 PAS domain S-box-containing protein [Pedobacter duraquae]
MENESQMQPGLSTDVLILSQQKQAILSAIIANSDDTIISKTLQGIITTWNPAAERMFGYTETEAIGKHISLIIPTDRLSEEVFIMTEISNGKRVSHFETIRISKSGKTIPLSLSISPIIDHEGRVIGASKIARDITEQLAVIEENARLYEQVKMLNEKKDEFIALASHELKTPLTSIQGYLQILTRTVTDERSQTFLQKAGQSVKRVSNMISELLDVSKIDAGKLQLNTECFDIHKLTEEAVEMLSHNNKQIDIRINAASKPVLVNGDPHRIEQVIINLLTNAIRYSPGTKEILVHLKQEEDVVKIGVQDFGIGIPADKLKNIFSKYYRVNSGNTQISGLGIGLYLCEEIIQRHNGQIQVESEVGVGSTFWFKLPM